MSGCTEEQALNWFEVWCQATLDERFHKVLALAKRTAEAEMKLEASRVGSEHWHAVALESQQERDALKARVAKLEKERTEVVEKCCYATDEERQSVLGGISLADHIRTRLDNIALQRDQAEATNRNNLRVSSDLLESKVKQMEHMDQDLQAARRECDALKARVAEMEKEKEDLKSDANEFLSARNALNVRVEKLSALLLSALLRITEPVLEVNAWGGLAAQIREALSVVPHKPAPVQPVVVTREMVEALAEEAETRALYGRTRNGGDDPDKPANAAARLVTELRKVLEVKL